MSDNCCADTCGTEGALTDKRWRLILWIALTLNAAMFFIEMGAGVQADLRALQADALDFFGDAANYAISNVAVLAAALGVLRTGSAWHDLGVAGIVAGLAITGGLQIMWQARGELKSIKNRKIAVGEI